MGSSGTQTLHTDLGSHWIPGLAGSMEVHSDQAPDVVSEKYNLSAPFWPEYASWAYRWFRNND